MVHLVHSPEPSFLIFYTSSDMISYDLTVAYITDARLTTVRVGGFRMSS